MREFLAERIPATRRCRRTGSEDARRRSTTSIARSSSPCSTTVAPAGRRSPTIVGELGAHRRPPRPAAPRRRRRAHRHRADPRQRPATSTRSSCASTAAPGSQLDVAGRSWRARGRAVRHARDRSVRHHGRTGRARAADDLSAVIQRPPVDPGHRALAQRPASCTSTRSVTTGAGSSTRRRRACRRASRLAHAGRPNTCDPTTSTRPTARSSPNCATTAG